MALICIIIITLGTAIALISFILALKLSFSTAFKNPFFYSQTLSFIGLCGLIFYGTDFFDANRHQLSFTFEAGLPALLESISKVLWPFLGFLLLSWVAYQLISILKNPGIYEGLAQTIWGGLNKQNASQNPIINNESINFTRKDFDTPYHKEEYEKLKAELQKIPTGERSDKLLDFAVMKNMVADFEYIFSLIYGTQVSALKALANNMSLDIRSFYDEYLSKQKTLLPNQNPLPYDQWENFFLGTGLAIKEGNVLKIQPKGRDFLKYISQRYERAL